MIFGLATIGIYFYLISNFDTITLSESKNYLIILPVLFILGLIELFCEVKWGWNKIISWIKKAFIWIKNKLFGLYRKTKFKILSKKLANNKKLSNRQLKWLAKFKEESKC